MISENDESNEVWQDNNMVRKTLSVGGDLLSHNLRNEKQPAPLQQNSDNETEDTGSPIQFLYHWNKPP